MFDSLKRRELLTLLGIGVGSAVFRPTLLPRGNAAAANPGAGRPFAPVPYPLPLANDGLNASQQRAAYSQITLADGVVVPEGFQVDVVASWGEPLGNGRFGFNNDYLAFNALGGDKGLLTVNF